MNFVHGGVSDENWGGGDPLSRIRGLPFLEKCDETVAASVRNSEWFVT